MAAASWFLGIRGYDSRNITDDDVRRKTFRHGDTLTIERQYPVEMVATGEALGIKMSWIRTLDGEGGKTTQKKAKAIKMLAERALKDVRGGKMVILPLVSYYGAGRLWVPARDIRGETEPKKPASDSRLDGYRCGIDPRINFADLFRWLQNERYISLEKGWDRFGFSVVKAAMRDAIENCSFLGYSVRKSA